VTGDLAGRLAAHPRWAGRPAPDLSDPADAGTLLVMLEPWAPSANHRTEPPGWSITVHTPRGRSSASGGWRDTLGEACAIALLACWEGRG
jgi:hypothetical protein